MKHKRKQKLVLLFEKFTKKTGVFQESKTLNVENTTPAYFVKNTLEVITEEYMFAELLTKLNSLILLTLRSFVLSFFAFSLSS